VKLLEHFFRVLAPSNCLKCNNEGSLLCSWCAEEALPDTTPRCYRCNALAGYSRTCLPCRRKTPLAHLWVRTEFSDIARSLIHKMKFSYSGEAADLIALELTNILPSLKPGTILVPVPTTTSHVRQRGFDHAARIARVLAAETGYQFALALARTNQLRQVGSSRRKRLEQMEDSFRVRTPYLISGANVVLIDDVITTGATLESAGRALKAAGAKTVDAIVFAQAK
jgi:ComF family protein